MLKDGFGREVTEIRISLTDRCNFDCIYCHNEGLGDTRGPMAPAENELGTDEVVRILEVLAEFDIEAVKFTGGEPMLRQDLEEIVRRTPSDMEPSLTTNGIFLPHRAEALAEAGLERVNISLDAMDAERFSAVTKTGAFDRVIDGIDAAIAVGLSPVKLNMVVFEATASHIPDMVEYVGETDGLRLQLIEYMPEIAGNPEWAIDIDRVHAWLASRADRIEARNMHNRQRYWIDGGMVEIVDPVGNQTFCDNCQRVRITHDGKFKGCLNRLDDYHSMGSLTKPEIRRAFRETVSNRIPYYGEYLVQSADGWKINDTYAAVPQTLSHADD